jgi:hypothetical protein
VNQRLLAKSDRLIEGVELLNLSHVVAVPDELTAHLLTLQAEAGVQRVRLPATCLEAHVTLMEVQGLILETGWDYDPLPYSARGQARRSVGIGPRAGEPRVSDDPLTRGWRWSWTRRRWIRKVLA